MPHRLKFDVDQSEIDTCHMCHMAVRPTPVLIIIINMLMPALMTVLHI